MNPLEVLLGILLLFFLPGWLLLRTLLPGGVSRDEAELPFQVLLGVVMSVAITIVVGSILGFLPNGSGMGWFQGAATGSPILESILGVLTVGLAVAAYWRGGLPVVDRALSRTPRPPADRGVGQDRPVEPVRAGLNRDLRALRRRSAQLTFRLWVLRVRNLWPQAESARRHGRSVVEDVARERAEVEAQARQLRDEAVDALDA